MPERTVCLLCASANSRVIFDKIKDYRFGIEGNFQISQCLSCGLVYTSIRPTRDEITRYYPTNYATHVQPKDSGLTSKIRQVAARKNLGGDTRGFPFIVEALGSIFRNYATLCPKKRNFGRLLDIGCGNGLFLRELQEVGWICEGIEVDSEAASIARSMGCKVETMSFDDVEYPDGYFDVVRLNHSLEHAFQPTIWLQKVHRILKSSGEVYIGVPDYNGFTTRVFGKYSSLLEVPRHLSHFNQASLFKLLESTGFKPIRIGYNSFHSDYPLISINNFLRNKLGFSSRVIPNIYLTPLPLISIVLDALKVGDNLEVAAQKHQ